MLLTLLGNLSMFGKVPGHGQPTSSALPEDEGGKSHRDKDLLEIDKIEEEKLIHEDEEIIVLSLANWLTNKN